MELYNQNLDKIENLITITVDNANVYVDKLTESKLNENGYFYVSYKDKPDSRYYTSKENKSLINNIYEVSYMPTEKNILVVQDLMYKDLAVRANEKEESGIIVGGLDIATDAKSQARLTAGVTFFGRNPTETRRFEHKNGFADATETSLNVIQDELANHIETVTLAKEVVYKEFMAFETIEECILYEAEPYDYELTEDDVLNSGEGQVGDIVIRYKNKVKDWE